METLIRKARAPYAAKLAEPLALTEGLLYRRGNFNGTLDDVICDALLAERDAEIALSPGFRWGSSLLPDQEITGDDLYNQTAITYPAAYRSEMTGAYLKEVLEDVADNLFNPDPYYQQGGDMVRAGGLAYTLTVDKPAGQRISDMVLLRTGETIDAGRKYVASGWASVNQATEGPPIYDVVAKYIERMQRIRLEPNRHVKLIVSDPAGLDQAEALSGARK
jgi:sulfur-oxidizing protein SoxB